MDVKTSQLPYVESLDDTIMYYGIVYEAFSLLGYNQMKSLAEHGNGAAKTIVDEVASSFANLGKSGHNTTVELDAGHTMNVDHVSDRSPFLNMSSAVFTVQKLGDSSKIITVGTCEEIVLPEHWTAITVVNTSQLNGVFRIKIRSQS